MQSITPVLLSGGSGTLNLNAAATAFTSITLTPGTSGSTVNYGSTSSYGTASTSDTFTTSHSITLTGLANSTTYHFQVASGDSFGKVPLQVLDMDFGLSHSLRNQPGASIYAQAVCAEIPNYDAATRSPRPSAFPPFRRRASR